MEQLKKGYYPVYVGEEGYIIITMKAYLAAAEYAGAEDIRFWYDELCYDMIDAETREDEIEGGYFTFMPREPYKFKVGDTICPNPEARADEIFSDLEDAEAMYMLINDHLSALDGQLYDLRIDKLLKSEVAEIDDEIQDIALEMARYEKMLMRIIEYIRIRNLEVKKE